VVKNEDMYGSWKMVLYYQAKDDLQYVTDFCVRGSDVNTADGLYFLLVDKPTRFTVDGEYFSSNHNFVYIIAKDSWYIHPAPWNNGGLAGCPTTSSSGCINMRQADLDLLVAGGMYKNLYRGEVVEIPEIGVGTPLVITDNDISCLWLGQCLEHESCKTGWECFRKFSCKYCSSAEAHEKWSQLLKRAPSLELLGAD
jgi:hypothetical protein